MYPSSLQQLIDSFKYLPGIGDKTAERLAFAIMDMDEEKVSLFSESIAKVKENIHRCAICNSFTDKEKCDICSDKSRGDGTLCIVEDPKSVFLFEKLGLFTGKYHVLNGLISPLEGVGPDDIELDKLIDRVKKEKFASMQDVLFINGCTLPHPERYRVDHQFEQLESYGYSLNKVYYENLTLDMLKYYRTFIFFRCPITPLIDEFIDKAHYFNKKVFFDIDDLVINRKYTDTIPFVSKMNEQDKAIYDDGVIRMEQTLKKCDYLITTTEALARELSSYGKEVYINKNVASERMVELSLDAIKNVKKDKDKIIIGYLSGSITHNPDFELIKKPLVKIMEEYDNVYLEIMGYLDIPQEFDKFKNRIIKSNFTNWQKLPEVIRGLDINLAPIEKSIFNEAKSENKWTEASLCKVVTVASNFGAFKNSIVNKETGLLCDSEEEWYKNIKYLIDNPLEKEKIENNAFNYVLKNYVTTYTGLGLFKYIDSKLVKNFAFVLPTTNISGGVNVVIKHCNILRNNGYDVTIINNDNKSDNIINKDGEINVISSVTSEFYARFYAITATLWATLDFVKKYPQVEKKLYLVQNFETNFGKYGDHMKTIANATYNCLSDIKYITISKWCSNWLKDDYNKKSLYAPNGIDVSRFSYKEREFGDKIKILVEGNSDDYYKNVDESFKIVDKLDKNKFEIHFLSYQGKPKEWYYVDKFMHRVPYDEVAKVYQDADILIKSSILESFSYPPLEMMATGGYCVVAPNEGNIEYLKDEYNCLFYEQGNIMDAVDKIKKLISDEKLRKKLVTNGKKTVEERDWNKIEKDILNLYISKE